MAIDIARFHQAFFEESFERADTMEQALLLLNEGGDDHAETVNNIFRAAHSIKGGAATFGFSAVAEFTHHLETLLDRVRSGSRLVDAPLVNLMLRAADLVRALLVAAKDNGSVDAAQVASLQLQLQQALHADAEVPAPVAAAPAASVTAAPAAPAAVAAEGYRIRFVPQPQMFRSGNDPLRIIREMETLGRLESELLLDDAPSFAQLDPESCHIGWNLTLHSSESEAAVRELFAWVEDECELRIEPLAVPAAAVAAAAPPVAAAAPPEAAASPSEKVVPIKAPPPAPAKAAAGKTAARANPESASIRVSTDKIDNLMNLVGEMVITQASLSQYTQGLDPLVFERLLAAVQQLEHTTRRLQESVMSTRMLPIESVFSRFPRMVHDLAARLGKQVRLQTFGESTELDKGVIEKIGDPLTHLVRNCVDHGIETPEDRIALGKPAQGILSLKAAHQGGQIVIEITDDGRGLSREKLIAKARASDMVIADNAPDSEVWNLIFAPGFSTAAEVTDVSGRGVGMDVVKRNIESLSGQIELFSRAGEGMTVRIRLPLTLAILDGMFVAVGAETFIVPLNCVVESLRPVADQIKTVAGQSRVLRVRDEYIPLVPMDGLFKVSGARAVPEEAIAVIVESEGRKVALQVDDLLGQQQVVIKSLEAHYRRVFGISGASILGDGRVALIVDVTDVVRSTGRAAA